MHIVFFSNVSNNTARFVEKLDLANQRIPIFAKEPPLYVDQPYVLVCPTYGGGNDSGTVPKQVKKFLNIEANRDLCVGVIGAGNTNFGVHYATAGDVLSAKLRVPLLYRFELLGTPHDVEQVRNGLINFKDTHVDQGSGRITV